MNATDFGETFLGRVLAEMNRSLKRLGLPAFDVGPVELQLSAHHDGGFYKVHRDGGPGSEEQNRTRYVTFVYYFFEEPAPFEGGDLLLYDDDRSGDAPSGRRYTRLIPRDNSLVLFPSGAYHQVTPVRVPSGEFHDGRFALNGWVCRADR